MKIIPFSITALLSFTFLVSIVSCQKNMSGINTDTTSDKQAKSISNASYLVASVLGFEPSSVIAGDSTKIIVGLSKPAPAGGIVITLDKQRSAGPVVGLPKTLFIATGETSGSTYINTIPFKDNILESIDLFLPSSVSTGYGVLLVTPRPKSDTRPPLQFFEAENAILQGVVAKKADVFSQASFSNGAYAEYGNAKQAYALFNLTPNQAGANVLEFRYAWRTSADQQIQPLNVLINGRKYSLSFPLTANNTSNNLVYINANLNAGTNKIYIGTQTGNANGLRLDNLTVAVP